MGKKWDLRAINLLLLLMAVKSYVTQLLIVSTFPTAKNGTTVNCAPNAISPPAETQGNTLLGVRESKRVSENKYYIRLTVSYTTNI